eukprot:scaffold2011_cov26-Cyclotella_meneghiniana.AAC.6
MFAYYGLPMGGGNSPGVACRGGEAFLRLVRESHHLFRGTASANCWCWTGFQNDGGYDPRKGYGYNLTNHHGLVVKLWGFVDDFIKHAPNRRLVHLARMFFLDVACRFGFLCLPTKCPPPGQQVKFIGFEFDTRLFPTLHIPLAKRERSLRSQLFSRLSLAISTGILQSLVDGTPNRIGNTYLRAQYDDLHPPDAPLGLAAYCTKTTISPAARKELRWWESFLKSTWGRPCRMLRSATLVPNWGDGSGTGTGGTLGLPDRPLKMWQGQWSPVVYRFSSNWKELKTLHLTLLHICDTDSASVRATTVFYITDNSTTYWIGQSGSSSVPALHSLILSIKLLELELGCHLQVIHVPGVVMILQGSDALSRGVWITPFQDTMDQRALTAAVFAPLCPDQSLIQHFISQFQLPLDYFLQEWDTEWLATTLMDTFSVWFPPPGLARQAIVFMLSAWVQRPRTSSALFFVPRSLLLFNRVTSRWPPSQSCPSPLSSYILPLMFPPFRSNTLGWTSLPRFAVRGGIVNKPSTCAGCHQSLSLSKHILTCHFSRRSFNLPSGTPVQPCGVSYHTCCFPVGPPFSSRLKDGRGLFFPGVRHWGTFICELCTVRAVVNRELHCVGDFDLLRVERMRIIDMANAWATGTHRIYQQKLTVIRAFETTHQFGFLSLPQLPSPPVTVDIPLMWIHESYSLRPSTKVADSTVAFASIRSLRSAATTTGSPVTVPGHGQLLFPSVHQGHMTGRLVTESNPATALLFRHVA